MCDTILTLIFRYPPLILRIKSNCGLSRCTYTLSYILDINSRVIPSLICSILYHSKNTIVISHINSPRLNLLIFIIIDLKELNNHRTLRQNFLNLLQYLKKIGPCFLTKFRKYNFSSNRGTCESNSHLYLKCSDSRLRPVVLYNS